MNKSLFVAAIRHIQKYKTFALLNVVGLVSGIFVCLSIYIWIQKEVDYDLFHPEWKRTYRLTNTFTSQTESFSQAQSGPAFGVHLPKEFSFVEAASRLFPDAVSVQVGSKLFLESRTFVADSNFFQFFGFETLLGNPQTALLNPDQIVLTETTAIKYFGSAEKALGQTLRINQTDMYRVSAISKNPVRPSHLQFDLLLPYASLRRYAQENNIDIDNRWVGGWPYTYLKITQPSQHMTAVSAINTLAQTRAGAEWRAKKFSYAYHLQPIQDIHLYSALRYDASNNGSIARVRIFSLIGILVLLMACVNYINLSTAVAARRAKEIAIRKIAGSSKLALIGAFLLETLFICILGLAVAIALVHAFLPYMSQWLGSDYHFTLSPENITFISGFILLLTFVSGYYPAYLLSSFQPATILKGNYKNILRGDRLRKTLVIIQVSLSILLAICVSVILQQMNYIQTRPLGFDKDARIEIRYYNNQAANGSFARLRDQLLQSPHVINVSRHSQSLVGGLANSPMFIESKDGSEASTSAYRLSVDSTFAETYGLQLAAGRFFSARFPSDSSSAVMVNEAAVRAFGWGTNDEALGKRFGRGNAQRQVIGVIKNFHFESLQKPVNPLVVFPTVSGQTITVLLDPQHLSEGLAHIRKSWASAVSDFPLEYLFVSEKLISQYGQEQNLTRIFIGFCALAILIACIGLFALSSFVTEKRKKEITIRKIIGARTVDILWMLTKEFLVLAAFAFLVAAPASWISMNQWLQGFAYRIGFQPIHFLVPALLAIIIVMMTTAFTCFRAATANPANRLE